MASKPLSLAFTVSEDGKWDLPFSEAIAAAAGRGVVLPDIYYGELQGIARQLSFSVAGISSLDQLQAVKDSLDAAHVQGMSYGEWKQMAAAADLGLPEHRLDNIFRTNLQGNYQSGRWEQIVRNQDERPMLMYDAINDDRVRPSHLAMDGTIRKIDDPWWDTHAPPNGYRCRCSVISLTDAEADARTGPDTGLDKVPRMPDGSAPEPDPGWDYSPRERLKGVEQAVQDRKATDSPVLFSALTDKLAQDMKTISLPGWDTVEGAVETLAKRRPEWFREGFDGIHAVSNPEFFAAIDGGTLYFSDADELVSGFKPASLLVNAIAKAGKGENLAFNEEYALEVLWHEIMHSMTGIRAVRHELGKEPFEEGLVQMASRFSYAALVSAMGGKARHQDSIATDGYAYPRTARNLVEMVRLAGLDGGGVAKLVVGEGVNARDRLAEEFSKGLNIRQDRINTLYGHAVGKPLQDFVAKIGVLARNAPRNNP